MERQETNGPSGRFFLRKGEALLRNVQIGDGYKMTEEILEIVNKDNQVTGRAPRSQIHAQQLMHRAVHIFLFNSRGELFLQTRSAQKDEFPGYYDSSAAGHVDPQESYA